MEKRDIQQRTIEKEWEESDNNIFVFTGDSNTEFTLEMLVLDCIDQTWLLSSNFREWLLKGSWNDIADAFHLELLKLLLTLPFFVAL